ncbi:MAG: hypothetical protein KGH75_08310, partial [Rhodospirillales bacterium]|nr:hypothetical protein [Rhodospirillales bacterium]
ETSPMTPREPASRFRTAHRHGHGNWYPNHRFDLDVLKGLRQRGYNEDLARRLKILGRTEI